MLRAVGSIEYRRDKRSVRVLTDESVLVGEDCVTTRVKLIFEAAELTELG